MSVSNLDEDENKLNIDSFNLNFLVPTTFKRKSSYQPTRREFKEDSLSDLDCFKSEKRSESADNISIITKEMMKL